MISFFGYGPTHAKMGGRFKTFDAKNQGRIFSSHFRGHGGCQMYLRDVIYASKTEEFRPLSNSLFGYSVTTFPGIL